MWTGTGRRRCQSKLNTKNLHLQNINIYTCIPPLLRYKACHIWNLIPNSFRQNQNISVREFKIGYDRFKEDEKEGIKYFVL